MKRTGLEVPIMNHCPPWECMTSSHCWSAVSWPTRPVRTRRMVDRTLRHVSRTAKEPGSSRSCAASNGSTWCINPSGAVLTGVDVPTAPPPSRVIRVIRSDLSGFSGHKARVACACVAASACLVRHLLFQ